MSTIHIKVRHKEEKKLFVKDLAIADIFTLKEDDNQVIYLMMPVTGGYRRAVCLGTGVPRPVADTLEVGEKFAKAEIILTPM